MSHPDPDDVLPHTSKSPEPLALGPEAPLAGELLERRSSPLVVAVAACALAMAACLIPQDPFYLDDELPRRRNRPPRILEELVQPSSRRVTTGNGLDCRLTFVLPAVEDPDVGDLLTVHWYADYDVAAPTQPFAEDVFFSSGRALRDQPVELAIALDSPGNPLQSPGVHIVEALITDGRLVGRLPQPLPSEPDAGVNLTYAVSHAWTVIVEDGDCP